MAFPAYLDELQLASWNDVVFGVNATAVSYERKLVVHEYPFKDLPYLEDLAKGARSIKFTAYLVGDANNSAIEKRDELEAQLNTGATGTLVHPSYGSIYANVKSVEWQEAPEQGGMIAVSLTFIETNAKQSPDDTGPFDSGDTQDDVDGSADDLDDASDDDFFSDVGDTLNSIGNAVGEGIDFVTSGINTAVYAVQAVTSTVTDFAGEVLGVVNDASRIAGCVEGIGFAFDDTVNLGLQAFGQLTSIPSALNALVPGLPLEARYQAATTLLINAATTARANIASASTAAVQAVTEGVSVPVAVQALTEALRTGTGSPSDAIRVLSALASFSSSPVNASSVIGMAIANAVNATTHACIRASLSSLARACATYQPSNKADAQSVLDTVTPLFDAEIAYASANNDTKSSAALKRLIARITNDINKRSSTLSNVVNLTLPQSIPLKRLAMRLYGDASQDRSILARNPQIYHPLFSGLTVEVLKQ